MKKNTPLKYCMCTTRRSKPFNKLLTLNQCVFLTQEYYSYDVLNVVNVLSASLDNYVQTKWNF